MPVGAAGANGGLGFGWVGVAGLGCLSPATEPRTDDPDMLHQNMTQRLARARLKIGPVSGFDRKVLRRNDGAHVLPEGTPDDATDNPLAEPKPVPGKGQNVGGGR